MDFSAREYDKLLDFSAREYDGISDGSTKMLTASSHKGKMEMLEAYESKKATGANEPTTVSENASCADNHTMVSENASGANNDTDNHGTDNPTRVSENAKGTNDPTQVTPASSVKKNLFHNMYLGMFSAKK